MFSIFSGFGSALAMPVNRAIKSHDAKNKPNLLPKVEPGINHLIE